MIEGVKVKQLKQILDDRGKVMHMLRTDSEQFVRFGEIYFSCIYPRRIKAWKLHKEMTLNCAVPHGHVKFVLYDNRQESNSNGEVQEIFLGPDNYCLVTVPPMIWTGFQCIGSETAILANCASVAHTKGEFEHLAYNNGFVPYNWEYS